MDARDAIASLTPDQQERYAALVLAADLITKPGADIQTSFPLLDVAAFIIVGPVETDDEEEDDTDG